MKAERLFCKRVFGVVSAVWILTVTTGILPAAGETNQENKEATRYFYEDGSLKSEWNYADGKLEGRSVEYHSNGRIKTEWNFLNDKIDGIVKFYDEEGCLVSERHYRNNLQEGPSIEYYKDGSVRTKGNYKNGKMSGKTVDYYPGGNGEQWHW